jgi:hypothetical protein
MAINLSLLGEVGSRRETGEGADVGIKLSHAGTLTNRA